MGRNQSGFTLIEITVTMSIIGIMTMLIVAAYPAARDGQALQAAKQQIQGSLQDARHRPMNNYQDQK